MKYTHSDLKWWIFLDGQFYRHPECGAGGFCWVCFTCCGDDAHQHALETHGGYFPGQDFVQAGAEVDEIWMIQNKEHT